MDQILYSSMTNERNKKTQKRFLSKYWISNQPDINNASLTKPISNPTFNANTGKYVCVHRKVEIVVETKSGNLT